MYGDMLIGSTGYRIQAHGVGLKTSIAGLAAVSHAD